MEIKQSQLWRHKKSNGYYRIVALATIEADLKSVVVYRSIKDSNIWVRPLSEFSDSRFEYVSE